MTDSLTPRRSYMFRNGNWRVAHTKKYIRESVQTETWTATDQEEEFIEVLTHTFGFIRVPFKHAKCRFNTADLTSPPEELTTHSIMSALGMLYIDVCFLLIISAARFKAALRPVTETLLKLKSNKNKITIHSSKWRTCPTLV